eukprot:gene15005-biopygen13477
MAIHPFIYHWSEGDAELPQPRFGSVAGPLREPEVRELQLHLRKGTAGWGEDVKEAGSGLGKGAEGRMCRGCYSGVIRFPGWTPPPPPRHRGMGRGCETGGRDLKRMLKGGEGGCKEDAKRMQRGCRDNAKRVKEM